MRIPFKRTHVSKRDSSKAVAEVDPVLAAEQRQRVIEYALTDPEVQPAAAGDGADGERPATSERLGPMSGW